MGLVLNHFELEGINVNAELLFMVTYINVIKQEIDGKIIKREYYEEPHLPNWIEQVIPITRHKDKKIQLTNELCGTVREIIFQEDKPRVRIYYEGPEQYKIARVDYEQVAYSWRRAFKEDGIYPEMFGLKTKEFFIEKTKNGLELIYALAVEPSIDKDVAFYIINNNAKYKLIARIVEGKIASPGLENNANIQYPFECITNEEYLKWLTKKQKLLLYFYRYVPSAYPFMKETVSMLKKFREWSNELKAGNASKSNIEDLIWSCK